MVHLVKLEGGGGDLGEKNGVEGLVVDLPHGKISGPRIRRKDPLL